MPDIVRAGGLISLKHLAWLYAPSPQAFIFAARTTAAAIIALLLAMWMELDSPQWAPMTVWIVAQSSRGESLSKGRWRLIGTFIGTIAACVIIALLPQQPFLFLPAIGLWLGVCCTVATLVRNFRAYGAVLAGYSCAIVGLAAVPDASNIFTVAVSRMTYIVLGIVIEGALASLFAVAGADSSRRMLREKLKRALNLSTEAVRHVLAGEAQALERSRGLFETILSINDQIEFTELEMGHHGSEGDHARAALAAVSVLLSRALGMATRMAALPVHQVVFNQTSRAVQELLRQMPALLDIPDTVGEALARMQALQTECRTRITDALRDEMADPSDKQRLEHLLDLRVLHQALLELLDDLHFAVREFQLSDGGNSGDRFHFRLPSPRDYTDATQNGVRATLSLVLGSIVWEVTAWPQGTVFLTIVALTCGIFAARENPVIATMNFLRGTVGAAFVAGLLSLLILPSVSDPLTLSAVLAVPMMIGGLAARNARTAAAATAFNLLLPALISPINGARQNEIAFFNGALATLAAVAWAVLVFRTILPFNPDAVRWRMRGRILRDLRGLAARRSLPDTRRWIGYSADRMARVIRHAGPSPGPVIEAYLQGTLAAMTIGLNLIRLRHLHARRQLPPSALRPVAVVLRRMTQFTGRYGRTATMARAATRALRRLELRERDLEVRQEMTRAIAYLLVISRELDKNAVFLDASRPFALPVVRGFANDGGNILKTI